MQHKTSIGSRIMWCVIAATILASTCVMGLCLLPAFENGFADIGVKPPIVTHAAFTFGPAALVTVGVIAAVLVVMGEFTPELRGIRIPLILLVVVLISSSLAAVFMPRLGRWSETIDPTAPASPSPAQPTNAP